MPWPLSQDYNEAIQNPATSLGDPELQGGQPVAGPLGLPMPRSGNFADVYEFVGASGAKWAIKCFTRAMPGLRERYTEISKYLIQAQLPFTVDFDFLARGIRIRGDWYPVLKMQWVEGLLLNEFVRNNLDKPAQLEGLGQVWLRMARGLRDANMAHADLQHGNVLLVAKPSRAGSLAVKLIDYDGMWVPALALKESGEVGHRNYQHPRRLQQGTYSAEVDRLPLLVIACALRCLVVGGKPLWDRYDNGDNLLFREADLQEPEKSRLFKELHELPDPQTRLIVQVLQVALARKLEDVPAIDDMLLESKRTSVRGPANPTTVATPALNSGTPVVVKPRAPAAAPLAPGTSRPLHPRKIVAAQSRRVPVWAWVAGGGGALAALAAVLLFSLLSFTPKPIGDNPSMPARATNLVFGDEPADAQVGQPIKKVLIKVLGEFDNLLTTDDSTEVTLKISANPSDGKLQGVATVKAVKGIAEFDNLSIDRAGKGYTLTASAGKLQGSSGKFDVTPAAAHHLEFDAHPIEAAAGKPLNAVRVKVNDKVGNAYTGKVTVEISENTAGVILHGSEKSTQTDMGLTEFGQLRIEKAGSYTLTTRAGNLVPVKSNSFKITSGEPSRLMYVDELTESAAGKTLKPVRVKVEDEFHNPCTDKVTIDISNNTAGVILHGGAKSTQKDKGVTEFGELRIEKAGSYVLTARAGNLVPLKSNTIKITSGEPAQLVFVDEVIDATAGKVFRPVRVKVEDEFHNPCTDKVAIEISGNPAGVILYGAKSAQADKGVTDFAELKIEKSGNYTLTARAGDLAFVKSKTFKIASAEPSKLLFVDEPTEATAGKALKPVRVKVEDKYHNPCTDKVTVQISGNPAGVILYGEKSTQADTGLTEFGELKIENAGSYTLTAKAHKASSVSKKFNIKPDVAATLWFSVEPAGAAVSKPIIVKVGFKDKYKNVVTTENSKVTLDWQKLSDGTSKKEFAFSKAFQGTASFELSFDEADRYTLTASAPKLYAANSNTFNITGKK